MTVNSAQRHKPHLAARIEDAVRGALAVPLHRAGWRPRLVGYTGYGRPGWVRVFGRVLLGPVRTPLRPAASNDLQRGWRAFVTMPVPDHPVSVHVGDACHEVRSDRGGYLDAVVPADLEPGWHVVRLDSPGTPPADCDVRVADPSADAGVVSDIDDTVMVTLLPRPLLAAWNTFVLREPARRPVPGMADLLRELQEATPGGPVVYLSTGAWNVAPTLERFLARNGYPPGPILLTDWGPTQTGWFRDGQMHKRTQLERLTDEFPGARWTLVGDDGQHDPEIYGAFAAARPGAVRGVAIRQLTAEPAAGGARSRVPWAAGPDGAALAAQLHALDVL